MISFCREKNIYTFLKVLRSDLITQTRKESKVYKENFDNTGATRKNLKIFRA